MPYTLPQSTIDALHEIIKPECLDIWLESPNAHLDGLKPIQAAEFMGEDVFLRMLHELRSGQPG